MVKTDADNKNIFHRSEQIKIEDMQVEALIYFGL